MCISEFMRLLPTDSRPAGASAISGPDPASLRAATALLKRLVRATLPSPFEHIKTLVCLCCERFSSAFHLTRLHALPCLSVQLNMPSNFTAPELGPLASRAQHRLSHCLRPVLDHTGLRYRNLSLRRRPALPAGAAGSTAVATASGVVAVNDALQPSGSGGGSAGAGASGKLNGLDTFPPHPLPTVRLMTVMGKDDSGALVVSTSPMIDSKVSGGRQAVGGPTLVTTTPAPAPHVCFVVELKECSGIALPVESEARLRIAGRRMHVCLYDEKTPVRRLISGFLFFLYVFYV